MRNIYVYEIGVSYLNSFEILLNYKNFNLKVYAADTDNDPDETEAGGMTIAPGKLKSSL